MKPKYKVGDMVLDCDGNIKSVIIDIGVFSYCLEAWEDGSVEWIPFDEVENTYKVRSSKSFKELCTELAKEWVADGGYNTYNSILEFLDGKMSREDYLRLDGNELIHEKMRCELNSVIEGYDIVVSGLMECYDFCQQTKNMSKDEILSFENFRD